MCKKGKFYRVTEVGFFKESMSEEELERRVRAWKMAEQLDSDIGKNKDNTQMAHFVITKPHPGHASRKAKRNEKEKRSLNNMKMAQVMCA
jgi:hypothetical protein